MKYLIYARVSERGSGFEGQTTIPMQIKICEDYIRIMGGEVFDSRSDEFISGKNIEDRPAFRSIMEELRSGTAEWDAIIVYKFSRISRRNMTRASCLPRNTLIARRPQDSFFSICCKVLTNLSENGRLTRFVIK